MKSIPDTLSIIFCPVCGRTDRWDILKEKHFHHGKLCKTSLQIATYRIDKNSIKTA